MTMTNKKYKSKGHRYDWGEALQFMKDNPELMQMGVSMLQGQQGEAGTNGDTMLSKTFARANTFADTLNGLSEYDRVPVGKAIGLPGQYYACGGNIHKFDGGGPSAYIGAVNTAFDIGADAINLAKGVNTRPYEEQVKTFGNQQIGASNNQDLLNSWQNRRQLSHVNKYDITGGNKFGDIFGGVVSNLSAADKGAMAGSQISPGWGTAMGAIIGGTANLAGQIIGARKTRKRIKRLNNAIDVAMARQDKALNDAALNVQNTNTENIMANFSAFGGPIYSEFMPYNSNGPSGYDITKDIAFAKQAHADNKNGFLFNPGFTSSGNEFAAGGGIHIAPSKKGTFTAAATKHGKSVQAFASQVLANPDDYSTAMVKKANFARNAAKWHADGGPLLSEDFTNGVTMINQGGTHENNPHEGVPMGIAPDGKPNLVEEGEVIYNDYVFSNRLRVPKEVRSKYKFRGPKDMTFAEAFKEAQKESQERPNDPISENGLENLAMVLARTQEAVRGYEQAHSKADGGHLYGLGDTLDINTPLPKVTPIVAKAIALKEEPGLKKQEKPKDDRKPWFTLGDLRYADALANLGAVTSDLMGLTNTPTTFDYIPGFQAVSAAPIGNYIPVTHFDTRYAANQAAQQAAATRNAIMQSSAPNRNAALLAADYNAQIANGQLLRDAAMQDYNMMIQREQFNRGTNQANSQLALEAAMSNQKMRPYYANLALQQAKMNDDASNMASAARAANLSALAESTSNIGREATDRGQVDMLIDSGVFGTISKKPYWWSDKKWKDYQNNNKACGGKIKRKKKGLTY